MHSEFHETRTSEPLFLDKSSFMSGFLFSMFSKELQQTFFKEVMSLFQDLVDQQTDKLTTDTGKVNGRKAESKLYYLCQYSFDSS